MNTDAPVDLRSDTLTHPTDRMRQAMHAAEVGDDTFGDDPTVKRLEAMAAERLGKEAALYVPSGSMGNSTALITYLEIGARSGGSRPALAVHETHAHMFSSDRDRFARALFEVESAAVDTEWGVLTPEHVQQAIAAHPGAEPLLLCIENTHNYTGGGAVTPDEVNAVAGAAHAAGMRVHCDGARLFNAAIAQGVPAAELVARKVLDMNPNSGNLGLNTNPVRLRGTGTFGLSGEPAVFLDGVRIGTFGPAMEVLSQIPARDVRNIRVLRGPASGFLQGSADGSIHIGTRSGPG